MLGIRDQEPSIFLRTQRTAIRIFFLFFSSNFCSSHWVLPFFWLSTSSTALLHFLCVLSHTEGKWRTKFSWVERIGEGKSKRCTERDAQKSALEETDPRDLDYIYGGLLVRAATTLRKSLTDGPWTRKRPKRGVPIQRCKSDLRWFVRLFVRLFNIRFLLFCSSLSFSRD